MLSQLWSCWGLRIAYKEYLWVCEGNSERGLTWDVSCTTHGITTSLDYRERGASRTQELIACLLWTLPLAAALSCYHKLPCLSGCDELCL